MSEVIRLSGRTRASTPNTAEPAQSIGQSVDRHSVGDFIVKSVSGGDVLIAAKLYEREDQAITRFLDVASRAAERLKSCSALLRAQEFFAADDKFMQSKYDFYEMFLSRDLSESIGYVSMKCFQVCGRLNSVRDDENIPDLMLSAVTRLWREPFVPLEHAIELVRPIEDRISGLSVPGYNELAEHLIAEWREPAKEDDAELVSRNNRPD